jgi:3-dehydroquinate synthase
VSERSRQAVVVGDRAAERFVNSVVDLLQRAGITTSLVNLHGGEGAKSFAGLRGVLEFLEGAGLDRSGCVVAVGGGSIGDLAGFAAAVWMRGVAYFQVPTTLLAMVDSSIGGKTAINTDRSKNAVGAFWQPAAVVADLDSLETLPPEEFRSAFGEIVKYAMAMDRELFDTLSRGGERLRRRDWQALETVVARCAACKAGVVASDEFDRAGVRAVLNYGHTAGHALEVASGYRVPHGVAISHGMRVAAAIGARMLLCDRELASEQDRLLAAFGLPGGAVATPLESVLEALPRDKKSESGRPRWVLPRAIGRAEAGHDVPPEVLREALTDVLSAPL